ncbi:hypothetical protein [Solitalea koreensis]|uniref:Uncharacterized protein n=1 Tax=Solitalea koreensis TaxID=543615 RepID=A0A521D287_9SPHI|nr:hypothetical protein [Solitalea koreensis]SMO65794.1 hypothetical protein SAMN06265350_105174 [Solitalea koreensis]
MNVQYLATKLAVPIGKKTVIAIVQELEKQSFSVSELIDLTFHTQSEIGFRAAWIFENYILNDKPRLLQVLPFFLEKFSSVSNPSCKRHFAKVLQEITSHLNSKKADPILREAVLNSELEPVITACFDWMIDPKVAVAVKVFCMESLFNMSTQYPWINEELTPTIEFVMKGGSAGIQARGRKLLVKCKNG